MAYASWSVVFGEQPSASKWNILGTNDASFNDGTGIFGLYKNLLAVDSNPYKFSAYRGSAQNVGTAATKVQFATENFDTNGDYDAATNYRYTAPVNGFYYFNSNIAVTGVGTGTDVVPYFYKNGSRVYVGPKAQDGAGSSPTASMSCFLELSATNYVEVYVQTITAAKALDVGDAFLNTFSGFLVCRT